VLIDSFLEDAFEADVDAIADGTRCVIGGVMQHIEDAGIHSGDSACVLPPYLITEAQVEEMRRHTRAFAERLGVVGLLNVQYAIKNGIVYVLEVNPRASRTIPFVSKAIGVPLASLAARDHDRRDARRPRSPRRRAAALRGREGGGIPLQQAARRRPYPRPGDAVHR
jgi:carbamoyl-phosphate synthase large subunit